MKRPELMSSLFVTDWEAFKQINPEGTEEQFNTLQESINEVLRTPMVNTSKTQLGFEDLKKKHGNSTLSDMELLNIYLKST